MGGRWAGRKRGRKGWTVREEGWEGGEIEGGEMGREGERDRGGE